MAHHHSSGKLGFQLQHTRADQATSFEVLTVLDPERAATECARFLNPIAD
jgi:hypothetical protein